MYKTIFKTVGIITCAFALIITFFVCVTNNQTNTNKKEVEQQKENIELLKEETSVPEETKEIEASNIEVVTEVKQSKPTRPQTTKPIKEVEVQQPEDVTTSQEETNTTSETINDEIVESKDDETVESTNDYISLGTFRITAYCNCSICCGKWAGGPTASGVMPKAGRTIAVDPKVIPLGTKVIIGGKTYVAEDTGGAIKGKKIDMYFASHSDALAWGVKYKNVSKVI